VIPANEWSSFEKPVFPIAAKTKLPFLNAVVVNGIPALSRVRCISVAMDPDSFPFPES
jgi:hypothetical protein